MNDQYLQNVINILAISKEKRTLQENHMIRDYIITHPLNERYQFRSEGMMQICMNAELEILPSNSLIYQQNDISEKFYVILKGQVGLYFQKEPKQRYEELKSQLSDDIYKYTVSEYKKSLYHISKKEKDNWFGEISLVNHGIQHHVAITETDTTLLIIDQKQYQRYIFDKELMLLKTKLKIFQSNIFADCSVPYQRIMYYMSSKQSYKLNSSVFSENATLQNIYIIKRGQFGIYKYIYDEESMTEQMANQTSQPTITSYTQLMRKKPKENKKYSKNTKIKVIEKNDVVGEQDVILRRTASYSCVCQDYEGGLVMSIPSIIFLYVTSLDLRFHNTLKEKLRAKMVDFNDKVHKISSQMQKFGDFFFFKARQPSEDKNQVKTSQVFDIDKQSKKIMKINVNEKKKGDKEIQEIKEIKQLVKKMQVQSDKDEEDHNDFSYFPINHNIHQKIKIQNTLPISSKDVENEILLSSSPLKNKQKSQNASAAQSTHKKTTSQFFQSQMNIPSEFNSQTNIILDQNSSFQSKITQKKTRQFKTQSSLQDSQLVSRFLDNEIKQNINKGKQIQSQRLISQININEDDESNNVSINIIDGNNNNNNNNNNINNNNNLQMFQLCLKINNQINSQTSIEELQLDNEKQQQNPQKSPIRSLSRRTIILNDKDFIEEENHQTSSNTSSDGSIVSPILHKKDNENNNKLYKNITPIQLDNQDNQSQQSNKLVQKSFSPQANMNNMNKRGLFQRKQKKALTIQCVMNSESNGFNDISDNYSEKKKIKYIDENKPLEYFEHRENLSPDNKYRSRKTISVIQLNSDNDEYQNNNNNHIKNNNQLIRDSNSQMFKKYSSSRLIDAQSDDLLQNFNNNTPKTGTNNSFSFKQSNQFQKSGGNISLNSKITDPLLLKAIGDSQNLKNEVLKQKDLIQVSDLKSSKKNELKSLIEIKNLQKRMNQKQDPTKYDEQIKTMQMRVLDMNIKLNEQKNKNQMLLARQQQEKELNQIYEAEKELIIRKHISKIGLASSQANQIQLNRQTQSKISPSTTTYNQNLSDSNQGSELALNLSGQQNRNLHIQHSHKSLSSESLAHIVSPLNNSGIKSKEQENNATKKASLFNIQATLLHSHQNNQNLNTIPFTEKIDQEFHLSPGHDQTSNRDQFNTQRLRSSFINYSDFTYSTPQHSNQKKIYADPLNIGIKANTSLNLKFEHDHDAPHTDNHLNSNKNNKKNKIHFKSSVDEYLELKANALSNNFDKKKIQTKDLPFLDSYANQLQINLKRLFYVKLKENYCKQTGFENVQQRIADQMLDKNFSEFLKKNKDILPEKQNLNYLYNWRKQSESPNKSAIDKLSSQLHQNKNNFNQPNQDFLKDNIPAQGLSFKKPKLPNLYEKQKAQFTQDSNTNFVNQSQSSMLMDKLNYTPKVEHGSNRSMIAFKRDHSNIFQNNEGREKIITDRAKQFYQNMEQIQNKQKKENKLNKNTSNNKFKLAQTSSLNLHHQISTLSNLDHTKKMSYKNFKDVYLEDADKLDDLQDKARNDLINLDKYYVNNQRAERALKNDNQIIEQIGNGSVNLPKLNKIHKQSTLDQMRLEEELLKQGYSQQDLQNHSRHVEEAEEELEESPIKIANRPMRIIRNHQSVGNIEKQSYYHSPNRLRGLPQQKNRFSLTTKSVEDEMKELTHSIILKYGLQSKFKNKEFK